MPERVITLPALHAGQQAIADNAGRLNAVRCGRRFGKTKMLTAMAADDILDGLFVGIFTPEHKQLTEIWDELTDVLEPLVKRSNSQRGELRFRNGAKIDCWYLNDNPLAGRGREYDRIYIDEAAFTKNGQMIDIWRKSINPTMVTRPGARAFVFSTPNGLDTDNFFWLICNDPEMRFTQHYAPSSANPYILKTELEREREINHPMIFSQEFLAEFIDWSGAALIREADLLVEGKPVQNPKFMKYVVAIMDTAIKSGQEHDGTGVIYLAYNPYGHEPWKVTILDWDIWSIDAATIIDRIPSIFAKLDGYTQAISHQFGSMGCYIEDVAGGSVLLQQTRRAGYPAKPIESKLTQLGKDNRVIACASSLFRGDVKISEHAFKKVSSYKAATRNHLLSQLVSFRIGDKDGYKRADDLLDCFTYGLYITLGFAEDYKK